MRLTTYIKIHSLFFIVILQILTLSCKPDYRQQLDLAESLSKTSPYIADSLLNNINKFAILKKESLAKWCILKYRIADSIKSFPPDIYTLEKTYDFYTETKDKSKSIESGIFLGRSYINKHEYTKAMNLFLNILHIAQQINDHNSLGYIHSYIGDIYEFGNDPQKAKQNYIIAQEEFYKTKNRRSYYLTYKDIARELAFQDSLSAALNIINKGESLAIKYDDPIILNAFYNAKGNIYKMMKNHELAEHYLLNAISINTAGENIHNYLSLCEMYLEINNIDKAYHYILKADSINNGDFDDMVLYNKYLFEKQTQNHKRALNYLEDFLDVFDKNSKIKEEQNIHELEKRYNTVLLESENKNLKISQLLLGIFSLIFLLLMLIIYIIYLIYKKEAIGNIKNLEENITSIKIDLESNKKELNKKKEDLDSYKKNTELNNAIYKKKIKEKELIISSLEKKHIQSKNELNKKIEKLTFYKKEAEKNVDYIQKIKKQESTILKIENDLDLNKTELNKKKKELDYYIKELEKNKAYEQKIQE